MGKVIPIRKAARAATSRFKFTMERLKRLKPPAKGSKYHFDTEVTRLAFRITANNARTYVLVGRMHGRPERITLGNFDAISLKGARDAALRLNGQLAAGVDIVAERKAARVIGVTVGELYTTWLRSAKTRRLKTWKKENRLWELHLKKKLEKKEAISLTPEDLQNVINAIAVKHPRTSNKAIDLVRRIFNVAINKEKFVGSNPAKKLDRQPEECRKRYLNPDELARFILAVEAEQEPWRGYFFTLLFTGGRRAAVAAMRWQDVDLLNGVWNVPSWDSKNGKALTVPLVQESVTILEALKDTRISDWVFPSPTSGSGHVESPFKAWLRICKRATLDDLRIHDVRRTVGSWLAAGGASNFVISKALGHLNTRSADVYVHLDTGPVREKLGTITSGWMAPPVDDMEEQPE